MIADDFTNPTEAALAATALNCYADTSTILTDEGRELVRLMARRILSRVQVGDYREQRTTGAPARELTEEERQRVQNLAFVFGPTEWEGLTGPEQYAIVFDAADVDDLAAYRKRIGHGNLGSYARVLLVQSSR